MTIAQVRKEIEMNWNMTITSGLKKIAFKNSLARKGVIEYNFVGAETELREAGHPDYLMIVLIKDNQIVACQTDESCAECQYLRAEYLDIEV